MTDASPELLLRLTVSLGGGATSLDRHSRAHTTRAAGLDLLVAGTRNKHGFEIECPHCHRRFEASPLEGGRAARYRGFKCPHCKLFVPLERATDSGLSRDPDAAS